MTIGNKEGYVRALADGTFLNKEPDVGINEALLTYGKREIFARRILSAENYSGRDLLVVSFGGFLVSGVFYPHNPDFVPQLHVGTAKLAGKRQDYFSVNYQYQQFVLQPRGQEMIWECGTSLGVSTDYLFRGVFLRKDFNEMQKQKRQAGMLDPGHLPAANKVDVPATIRLFTEKVTGWLADPQSFATGSLAMPLVLKSGDLWE